VRLKAGWPMAFAGLWESWMGPNGEEMETAAIVTTHANRALAAIHDRMPVIVPPDAFDFWLDSRKVDGETAAALIVPAREGVLDVHEVSPAVNRATNDTPDLVEPVTVPLARDGATEASAGKDAAKGKGKPDSRQGSLF
jgi:putative SOS response-associated peptidase YedK